MVLAWIGFRSKPSKRAEVLSAVDELVHNLRETTGCSKGRLLMDREDPNAFTVESEWRSLEDADAFLGSPEFQLFRGIRMLLWGEPFVVVDDIRSRTTGILK
jgi:quinol monooxygenase YgiN